MKPKTIKRGKVRLEWMKDEMCWVLVTPCIAVMSSTYPIIDWPMGAIDGKALDDLAWCLKKIKKFRLPKIVYEKKTQVKKA